MKKKLTILFAAVLMLCVPFAAACGGKGPLGGRTPTPGTLIIGIQNDATEVEMIEAVIKAYQKEKPEVQFELDKFTGQNYLNTVSGKATAKTLPDIMWVPDDYVGHFSSAGIILEIKEVLDSIKVEDYYESMLHMGKSQYTGKFYMVPRDYSRLVCYYNKSMFDKYSISYPTDGWSLAQFEAKCRELRAKMPANEFPADAMVNWAPVIFSFIYGHGGNFVEPSGVFTLDTPQNKAGLDAMKRLYDDALTKPYYTIQNELFFTERAAMLFASRPIAPRIESALINYDLVTLPLMPTPAIGSGASGYSMTSAIIDDNKEIALDFLKFLLSEKGQIALQSNGAGVPVLKSLAEDEDADWRFALDPSKNNDAYTKFSEHDIVVDYLKYVPDVANIHFRDNILSFCNAYVGSNYYGDISDYNSLVAQRMKNLQDIWEEFCI